MKMNYKLSSDDATYEFYDYYNYWIEELVRSAIDRKKVPFDRINKNKAKSLWSKFMKFGFVPESSYNILDEIAEIIVKNTARLKAHTELNGHSPYDPVEIVEDKFGDDFELDEETWNFLYDLSWDETTKNDFISDYGLEPLLKVSFEILTSKTPEERIVNCDKAFNVVHMRGDLAELFIVDGRSALDEIAGKEELVEKKKFKFLKTFENFKTTMIFENLNKSDFEKYIEKLPNYNHKRLDIFFNFDVEKDNIIKTEYEQVKNSVKDLFDKMLVDFLDNNDTYNNVKSKYENLYKLYKDYEILGEIHYISISPLNIKSVIKRLEKFKTEKTDEKTIINDYIEFLKTFIPVQEKLEKMKERIHKKEPKSITKQREIETIKGKINPNLKKVIDDIGENFRKVIEENYLKLFNKEVENFKTKYENGIDNYSEYRDAFYNKYTGWEDQNIKPFLNIERNTYKLKDDIENYVKEYSYKLSVEKINEFLTKMYDKLGGFLNELDDDFTVDYTGKHSVNDIHFKFSDGSKFSIRNQIVSHFRDNTFYYRYPTTFHDAFDKSGNKINNPSELTIKKSFLN